MSKIGIELEYPFSPKFSSRKETAKKIGATHVSNTSMLRTSVRQHLRKTLETNSHLFDRLYLDLQCDEIVMHPLHYNTLKKERRTIENLFKSMRSYGYYDDSKEIPSGMHINIDRHLPTVGHFLKILNTFVDFNYIFVQISGRKGKTQDKVALRPLVGDQIGNASKKFVKTIIDVRKEMLLAAFKTNQNMSALGITLADNRIEFKWFNTTLDPVNFYARIEFILILLNFASGTDKDFGLYLSKHKRDTRSLRLLNIRV